VGCTEHARAVGRLDEREAVVAFAPDETTGVGHSRPSGASIDVSQSRSA
jgi:hypothetical protein